MNMSLSVPNCMKSSSSAERTPDMSDSFDWRVRVCACVRVCVCVRAYVCVYPSRIERPM